MENDAPITNVLVLLSGGQDSTTALMWARNEYPGARLHALTAEYGQRHGDEIDAADEIAKLAGVTTHEYVDLRSVFEGEASALVDHDAVIAAGGGIPDREAPGGLPTSFVPGRNLIFLAVAAAKAAQRGAQVIVTGICHTDYSGYPDCRPAFLAAMGMAVNAAMPSSTPVRLVNPLLNLTKAETVRLMWTLAEVEAGADKVAEGTDHGDIRETFAWRALARSVTCYEGMRPGCGGCPACVLRAKGFHQAKIDDPAEVVDQRHVDASADPAHDEPR